ncbi:endo-rhamnogalacturonase f [Grosmannia clavigera kw1407]|uniref:Endo-rhamnogalacturonase f n=1 Tax=Grosmannia clavigera (strain kw1407 / UAMH 11150) TaxID=655863 RepID=F0XKG7_GROCL|nr:endo-rhamnogalacturonase f [Grosmannia clavigera kw1407]EFX01600.1 endo-rhamnogalacturonase f [Grosmannia clavigera kw1407]
MRLFTLLGCLPFLGLATAQLIGPVGPTTPLHEKRRICNVLDFGAVPDNSTDVADALESAFNYCVLRHPGSRLVIPEGSYLLNRSVVLSNATNWAFQVDGLISLGYGGNYTVARELVLQGYVGADVLNSTINGEGDGHFLIDALVIVNPVDFEFYSETGRGAFQGQGYLWRNANNTDRPRLIRLVSPINAVVHDLILVDSPKFHIVLDFVENVEVYHITVRGANLGSYDGVDIIGTNYWVHDIEVTNRDECVSVKSPPNHGLAEDLVYNQAGSGVSIGSLNHARNISIIGGNNIAFIKTYPGGSGYVTNITFENFRSKASQYGLNINQYWQNKNEPDTGSVALSNLIFRNFSGSVVNGVRRPPLYLVANDLTFARNVTVEDISIWTEANGYVVNTISKVFGQGDDSYSPNDGLKTLGVGETPTPYTTAITVTATPTGWTLPPSPTWAVPDTGYGTNIPIPVYEPTPLWRPYGDYSLHYWGTF